MILNYQNVELLGKTVFKRVKFKPPLTGAQVMESEACLLYNVHGSADFYGDVLIDEIGSDESMLMKCGNFIGKWKVTTNETPCEVITIHFFPDVIDLIFENNIPAYLKETGTQATRSFQKIEQSTIIRSFIESLIIYFDNPDLFT
ncbi:MAG: hypothetical protein AAFV80_16815, partial [Bacteroidota bacterium]